MSDEKLSEGLTHEQRIERARTKSAEIWEAIGAAPASDRNARAFLEGYFGDDRKNSQLIECYVVEKFAVMQAEIARLERERDAARSEALKEAAQIPRRWFNTSCHSHDDDPCCHVRTATEIEQRIRSIAPSVVSQPSREREVLGARLDEARRWYKAYTCDLEASPEDATKWIDWMDTRLATLTAAPASTGEQS